DLFRALNRLDRATHETQRRIPDGCTIIDLGLMEPRSSKWSEDLGQFQRVDLSIVADSARALPALRELVAADASALWPGRRARLEQARLWFAAASTERICARWEGSPLMPARLASEV